MQQPVRNLKPLATLSLGSRARLVEIRGGRELTRRLLSLGLRVGSEVRVEHHRGRGLVVSAGSARIALGGGIVEKLIVDDLGRAGIAQPSDPTTAEPRSATTGDANEREPRPPAADTDD
jgi:ferrous iron transport protein A